MGQEAENAEAVVEGHEDHVLGTPLLGVELRLGAPALAIAATVDPEGHGELLAGLAGSLGPDVQIEAVLAVRGFVAIAPLGGVTAGIVDGLIARMTELVADLHTLPGHDRLRLLPAEIADRRRCIRDSAINNDARDIRRHTLHLSAFDGQDRGAHAPAAPEQGEHGQKKKSSFHMRSVKQ